MDNNMFFLPHKLKLQGMRQKNKTFYIFNLNKAKRDKESNLDLE